MNAALLIGLVIFAGLAGLNFYSFFIGAPYFKTPKKAVQEALRAAGAKPGQTLYDLGAGDGKIIWLAEKEFGLKAVGFELSPIVYPIARINLFFHGIKKSRLYCRNFYKQNLAGADIVFCFLSSRSMAKLKPKFEQELTPGSHVISYAFSIPGWRPIEVIQGYPGRVYLYRV
jgi:hypothetical protein